ncbi:hypothetical protein KKB99_03910, partial [bacterium]|nr:hypothetical protein [bacterium]MBU1025138.1 hypothetical protein [bacterium]
LIILTLVGLMNQSTDAYADEYRKPPRKAGEPKALSKKEQLRVEGYMNYFSYALFRYFCIYGEYPASMNEILESGLIVFWPINPLTGNPVRIIRDIQESEYKYAGDICYVYDSSVKGYFKGIFETTSSQGWVYKEFPDVMDTSKAKKLEKSNPKSYAEEQPYRFAKSVVSLFGTLKDIRLDEKSSRLPIDFEELLSNNFMILKEYYNPKYTEKEKEHAGYYELGVDLDAGLWYSIYTIRPDYTYRYAHKFPWKGLSLTNREFTDEKFPDLKNPLTLLSPSKYPDYLSLPEKILMSVDDIQYVRDK